MIDSDAKILILGAGHIGKAIFSVLRSDFSCIRLIDREDVMDHPSFAQVDDFLDHPIDYIRSYDYCINTLPVYDPEQVISIVDACVKCNTHYLDITEDIHVADAIRQYCDSNPDVKSLIAPHCGLAPGMVQTIAQHCASMFHEVHSIDMYVGALPSSCSNAMRYHPMWSIDGLINEYSNPVRVLNRGFLDVVTPLGCKREIIINGIQYESFLTSGGCSTLIDTWKGQKCSVAYRTIRYPGHLDCIKKHVMWDMSNNKYYFDTHLLEEISNSKPVCTFNDTVVMLVEVTGEHGNSEMGVAQFSHQLSCPQKSGNHWVDSLTAIQRMTAGGVASVIGLHHRGKVKKHGYLRHEEISFADVLHGDYAKVMGFD